MSEKPRLLIGINYDGGFTFSRLMPDSIVGINLKQAIQDFMEDEAETALDHIIVIKDNEIEEAFDCESIW